jgi:uncharacterized protein DUF5063
MTADPLSAVAEFGAVAHDFCARCESIAPASEHEASTVAWLAHLYALALSLPKVGPENSDGLLEIPALAMARVEQNLKFFAGCYRELFNPDAKLQEEPVVGDLEDALLDIYSDMKRGTSAFRA